VPSFYRVVIAIAVLASSSGCGSATLPPRAADESAPLLQIKHRDAAGPQKDEATTKPTAPAAEVAVTSSCRKDKVEESGGVLGFNGRLCRYRLREVPDASEYSYSVEVRLTHGSSYAIWPDGKWTSRGFKGSAIVYDSGAGGLWSMTAVDVKSPHPMLALPVDTGWHAWRIVRTRERLVVWLDRQLVWVSTDAAQGHAMGIANWSSTVEARNVEVRPLTAAEAIAANAERTTGWRLAADKRTPAPQPAASKPARMVGACNVDAIDWKNREYAASKLVKKPFSLVDAKYRVQVKQVKPDPIQTLGLSEQGTEIHFGHVEPAELDGQAPQEVVVTLSLSDFGTFHGSSVPRFPSTAYVFRLQGDCSPALLGLVELDDYDDIRYADNALQRVTDEGYGKPKVATFRVRDGKLVSEGSKQVTQESLDAPLTACDEAKSLATLGSFAGKRGWDLLSADPCVLRKLRERLGKHRPDFEAYTNMGMGPLEQHANHLVSGGCQVHMCGYHRAVYSVSLSTGAVEAVVLEIGPNDKLRSARWLTASGKPTIALHAVASQFVDVGKAPREEVEGQAKVPPLPKGKHASPLQGFAIEEAIARLERVGWKCDAPEPSDSSGYARVGKNGATRIMRTTVNNPSHWQDRSWIPVTVYEFKTRAEAKRVFDDMKKNWSRNDGREFLFGDTVLVVLSRDSQEQEIAGIVSGKPQND
jgi:hypothetical protein